MPRSGLTLFPDIFSASLRRYTKYTKEEAEKLYFLLLPLPLSTGVYSKLYLLESLALLTKGALEEAQRAIRGRKTVLVILRIESLDLIAGLPSKTLAKAC
jgi:hypothetical protein